MATSVGRGAPGRRGRYLLVTLAVALVAGLATAVPVLAQDGEGPFKPQVVGGKPVPNGKYRFMTSIQADTGQAPPYWEHFCGGTLIDADSVMTAAHCADFIGRRTNENTLGYRDVRLDVGVTVLNTDQGEPRRIERLADVRVHPNYNGISHQKFDVAVIRLNNPVNTVEPIALAEPSSGNSLETPTEEAIVAGWGDTTPQPPLDGAPSEFPRRMQEGDPPIVSDDRCQDAYGPPNDPALRVYPALMVCAGQGPPDPEDTCQGDSGGPLFVDAAGTNRQIGITSFGFGCAAPTYPGVYTEVNARPVHDFISRAAGL